ncbi:2-oxoglutarate and iron-dependent oxygenase domain-containing protein [Vibrio profundum]|uniref:2-oxoglutarate and iron-dependent oxygenase domain-containing protein n=1 Tax=Vibrio profundum TaxID=2910247 RepID=UPI003D122948
MIDATIPKIDLSPLWGKEPEGAELVSRQIRNAYRDYGFAYLTNHNISDKSLEGIFEAAREFHNLSLSEKLEIKQNNCFRGYVPPNASQLKVSSLGSAKNPNQLDAFVMAFEPDKLSNEYKKGLYLSGDNQFPGHDANC